jgi:hypothetical protein
VSHLSQSERTVLLTDNGSTRVHYEHITVNHINIEVKTTYLRPAVKEIDPNLADVASIPVEEEGRSNNAIKV